MVHRIASIVALAGVAGAAHAQFTSYESRAAWEDDSLIGGGFETETFDGSFDPLQPSTGPIAFPWGTLEVEGIDGTIGSPEIANGVFAGSIFPASAHVAYVFTFDSPISGFGWDTFGAASGIAIGIETSEGVADILDFLPTGSFGDTFLGFTSGVPVSEVRIVASPSFGGTAVGEIFDADDLVFGGSAPCPVDLDEDGQLTLFAILAYQNLFDSGDPLADFDGDGSLTLFDFLEFQNLFDAGCE